MTDHRYDDAEVHAIFTRAANRQEEEVVAKGASKAGLTLTELQQIGAEAGIDPDHIADAARALALDQSGGAVAQPSSPWEVSRSRMLPGAMSDRAWEQTVGELRRFFKKHGTVSQFGDVREWNSGDEASSRPIQLRVEPSDHGTRVTLRCDAQSQVHLGYWAISLLGLVTVLLTVMMLAGSFEPQVWVLVAASGLGALLGLLGNEPLTRRWVAEQNNRFDVVTNRIEIIVGRDTMLETGGNE